MQGITITVLLMLAFSKINCVPIPQNSPTLSPEERAEAAQTGDAISGLTNNVNLESLQQLLREKYDGLLGALRDEMEVENVETTDGNKDGTTEGLEEGSEKIEGVERTGEDSSSINNSDGHPEINLDSESKKNEGTEEQDKEYMKHNEPGNNVDKEGLKDGGELLEIVGDNENSVSGENIKDEPSMVLNLIGEEFDSKENHGRNEDNPQGDFFEIVIKYYQKENDNNHFMDHNDGKGSSIKKREALEIVDGGEEEAGSKDEDMTDENKEEVYEIVGDSESSEGLEPEEEEKEPGKNEGETNIAKDAENIKEEQLPIVEKEEDEANGKDKEPVESNLEKKTENDNQTDKKDNGKEGEGESSIHKPVESNLENKEENTDENDNLQVIKLSKRQISLHEVPAEVEITVLDQDKPVDVYDTKDLIVDSTDESKTNEKPNSEESIEERDLKMKPSETNEPNVDGEELVDPEELDKDAQVVENAEGLKEEVGESITNEQPTSEKSVEERDLEIKPSVSNEPRLKRGLFINFPKHEELVDPAELPKDTQVDENSEGLKEEVGELEEDNEDQREHNIVAEENIKIAVEDA